MGRKTPEQARIRITFSGIPGVIEQEHAVDVAEDTPDHHGQAIADVFDQAQTYLAANRAAALDVNPVPAPAPAAKPRRAKKAATATKGKK